MADLIVALFSDTAAANRVRVELTRAGFATDRVNVMSKTDPGPASVLPDSSSGGRVRAFLDSLLAETALAGQSAELAERIEKGEAAVIVHPRGRVELEDASALLQRHDAKLIRRDCDESAQPTPVIGEHAAGKPENRH